MYEDSINIMIAKTYMVYICNWSHLEEYKVTNIDHLRKSTIYYDKEVKTYVYSDWFFFTRMMIFFKQDGNIIPF